MAIDSWLPVGFCLPQGPSIRRTLFAGSDWQIFELSGGGRALVVSVSLLARWTETGIVEEGHFAPFVAGARSLAALVSDASARLEPIAESRSPNTPDEALAFALSLRATRDTAPAVPLHDSIYLERFNRLLPTFTISSRLDDDVILGTWLTGGARVSARAVRRMEQILSWMSPVQIAEVLSASRIALPGQSEPPAETPDSARSTPTASPSGAPHRFRLPGRPELERFFNEFVVDIVNDRERYRALGIDFPSAIVLHGPPGCGKTFAVERLVDFLGWPRFDIDASSIASPYIHETSRKVSDVFEAATKAAPAVLVIDEMEAFLADRQAGTGHHRVEEVGEFLRRIPEASRNGVLVVAMTNRLEMVDPAILRRGRFDHVIAVGHATESEVLALLTHVLSTIPVEVDVDAAHIARRLAGRPLSDVAFIVREGARLAARRGMNRLNAASVDDALAAAPRRDSDGAGDRRIGF